MERSVAAALSRIPADRFPSVADFARALETSVPDQPAAADPVPSAASAKFRGKPLILVLGIGVLLGIGALFAWRGFRSSAPEGGPAPLAVLPFENLGDTADSYFADGMTDEIRGKLARLSGFQVIARASASQYRGTNKPLRQIAQELGVRYLLTGTVRWVKADGRDRVQVRPELVEIVRSGATVSRWGEPFDAPRSDVFQMQAGIAGQVASALRVVISPATAPVLAETPTANLAAYDEFLRGEQAYLGSSGPVSLRAALGHYQRAVALDSSFARAWGRVSQLSTSLYYNSDPAPELAEAAHRSAEKALALAPKLPEAYLAMGYYYTLVRTDYDKAIETYSAGLALNPAHAELLGSLGLAEQGRGNLEKAIEYMQRGLALDPRAGLYTRRLTRALTYAHRFAEAEAMSRRALTIGPTDPSAYQYAALLRLSQGDLPGARAALHGIPPEADSLTMLAYWAANMQVSGLQLDEKQKRLVMRMTPDRFDNQRGNWASTLATIALSLGDSATARAYADSALPDYQNRIRKNPQEPGNHVELARVLAILGRRAEAIRQAEQGVALLREGDLFAGVNQRHSALQALLLAGDHEKALDQLEILTRSQYYLTPAWLRVDPSFDPIRQHPRFLKLLAAR